MAEVPPSAAEYSAADIRVLDLDAAVRKWPGMYFPVDRSPAGVLREVVDCAVHPPPRVAGSHTTEVVAEITDAYGFSVTDGLAATLTDDGGPVLGYFGSLLTPDRLTAAAAAALSVRVTVEVWRGGRGFRQELAGLRPLGPPVPFEAPAGAGTRVRYLLDADWFGPPGITAGLTARDLLGPCCGEEPGPGCVVLRDLRSA